MLVETHESAEIRRYLLGNIQVEDERRKIEKRLMLDDDYFEEILIEEDELIQDYVDDQLSTDERRRFEKHFFISEERRDKIKFARALRRYINEQYPSEKRS
jgi:anti-sigma-K factor RskA